MTHLEHFEASLNELKHSSLVGIRDITEGEEATRLLTPNCQENLAMLASENLHFEAQFEIENMHITEQLIKYCHALPSLRVVINHLGFIAMSKYGSKQSLNSAAAIISRLSSQA